MKVLFAPDWRDGNAYQTLLAAALEEVGVEVAFLSDYRRGLPLSRATSRSEADLLHLHWPDAYYPRRFDGWDWLRRLRFPLDLQLALRRMPLVYTAHNAVPHGRQHEFLMTRLQETVLRRSAAVLVHSQAAADGLACGRPELMRRMAVVPHGDLSVTLGRPVDQRSARHELGLGNQPLCLMFGAVEPYKGIEPVLDFWRTRQSAAGLAVVGKPISAEYRRAIEQRAGKSPHVLLRLERLSEPELRLWLSAADCVLFNYQMILTSGAACLARSWGVPILIPQRLTTVDLDEPHPRVIRFDSIETDLEAKLHQALAVRPDFDAARPWRAATDWAKIARQTAQVYDAVLNAKEPMAVKSPLLGKATAPLARL